LIIKLNLQIFFGSQDAKKKKKKNVKIWNHVLPKAKNNNNNKFRKFLHFIILLLLFFQSQRLKLVPPRSLVDAHLSRNSDSCTKILQVSGGSARVLIGDGAAAAAQFFLLCFCFAAGIFVLFLFCFVLFLAVSIR
jgi:hypothetical protein